MTCLLNLHVLYSSSSRHLVNKPKEILQSEYYSSLSAQVNGCMTKLLCLLVSAWSPLISLCPLSITKTDKGHGRKLKG